MYKSSDLIQMKLCFHHKVAGDGLSAYLNEYQLLRQKKRQ